jgi:curved DNA-binding protein CbpA
MGPINYFDVLGVEPNATTGEIKKVYRKLVFKNHPDHNPGRKAQKNFRRITQAYNVLVDPVKRDEYAKGKNIAVTDEPWIILKNYWAIIYKRGFKEW